MEASSREGFKRKKSVPLAAFINGANVLSGSHFLKNACCSKPIASGRFSASTWRGSL
jgi:hypothetical protein